MEWKSGVPKTAAKTIYIDQREKQLGTDFYFNFWMPELPWDRR